VKSGDGRDHQHSSGWSFPTFGYVVGFVLAALVVGTLAGRGSDRTPTHTIGLMLAGNLTIYAVGVPWLMAYLHTNLTHTLAIGVLPFLVADTLKIAAAAALLPATWHHINRR
jgi:biotin transport system substrate-specific component